MPEHAPDFSQPCSLPASIKEPTRTHFPVLPPLPPRRLPAPEFSVSYKPTMHCWDLGFLFLVLFCSVLNTFKQGMHSPAFQEFIPLHKSRILTAVIFLSWKLLMGLKKSVNSCSFCLFEEVFISSLCPPGCGSFFSQVFISSRPSELLVASGG